MTTILSIRCRRREQMAGLEPHLYCTCITQDLLTIKTTQIPQDCALCISRIYDSDYFGGDSAFGVA